MNGEERANGGDYGGAQQKTPQKSQQPKALRFVTNYGAPHPKRRRIAAACMTCRRRKTACSGERPTCETCNQNKLTCDGYSEAAAPGQKKPTDGIAKQNFDTESEAESRIRKTPQQNVKHEHQIDPYLLTSNVHVPPQAPMNWPTLDTGTSGLPTNVPESEAVAPSHEAAANGEDTKDSLFSGPRNRMPYFRWLGPTAIMPGFKQMVVKVKRQDQDIARASTDGGAAPSGLVSPPSKGLSANNADLAIPSAYSSTPAAVENDVRTPLSLPFYDNSPMPPSELITHLANMFFTHLGCNYPFLQRERFMRDLEEKQVDAVLVDAICALAARFSTHSLLTQQVNDEIKMSPAEYGHTFGQRAKQALVDIFPCPTVAAVQAALLLAYHEFGESRDSGLWMYLGISIRMAQDLGLHKIEGLKYKGKSGPTPKMIKRESMSGSPELPTKVTSGKKEKDEAVAREKAREKVIKESSESMVLAEDHADEPKQIDEQKAVEQERVDTFWAVFFLDRVVSSGVGRRSTLRDKDIELAFPALDETDPKTGWPAAFPALIRIVHLYGRVADLLNGMKEASDITSETPKRLASMESQVTNFYQGLSPRLHFDAVNFQHYMKAGEGTNFVLLHFWFHTLIVLLHQPTLLKTFEGRMLQLFPNSQQLSMSSAKTIADILSYSQLMDAKASLGNPFTTQPIYIAACAFLKETAEQTATSNAQSRASSPSRKNEKKDNNSDSRPATADSTHAQSKRMSISESSNQSNVASSPIGKNGAPSTIPDRRKSSDKSDHSSMSAVKTANALSKHSLLATAASQHYQLCYKALEAIHTYWAGAKYILTVLDQKFAGVGDPLLYTVEEGESAMERPRPEPAFTSPGWRRKLSWGLNVQGAGFWGEKAGQMPGSPTGDLSKAIGWTLTGTMNSPSTNLAWHYPSAAGGGAQQHPQQEKRRPQMPNIPRFAPAGAQPDFDASSQHIQPHLARSTSSSSHPPPALNNYPSTSDPNTNDLLMDLNSPYQTTPGVAASTPTSTFTLHPPTSANLDSAPHNAFAPPAGSSSTPGAEAFGASSSWNYDNLWNPNNASMQPWGDMMIESQDVDMSLLGLDMMPWFDSYPTHGLSGLFDTGEHQAEPGADDGGTQHGTERG